MSPILQTRIPVFKPAKDVSVEWSDFRRGLNTLLKETEVAKNELVQADNLILTGKGVPTKRWGTKDYFMSSATGSVRGLKGFYQSDGTNQLLAVTDQGVLTRKSGASYSTLTGVSWASGNDVNMAQLGDSMYIVNGQRDMVIYSNPTLTGFPTIATPTGVFATQFSGVSGTNTYSYRVSAVSNVGETLASQAILTENNPQSLSEGMVKVNWTAVSTASGILQSYNVYGRDLGNETFIGSVDPASTVFFDDGTAVPTTFTFPPTADSTGGVNAKFVERFEDRLVFAGIEGSPTKVVISGKWPNHEKFDVSFGGNTANIEPDSGDNITGLTIFEDRIIVTKERSIWQITLRSTIFGNFTIWEPVVRLITKSHGCISNRSIVAVENDVFFLTRNGIYALGYEPNVINVLRTNEISAKIRPFFDNLSIAQKRKATSFYKNFKYGISFPGKDKTMVYDRERLAWMGPWDRDANVYELYFDSTGVEHLLYGEDDGEDVVEYSSAFIDDNGSAFNTTLRTRKEDFGDWTAFKDIKDVFLRFRNVQGEISADVRLQLRTGDITTSKSFSITTTAQNAGWGADQWGNTQWGDSEESGGAVDTNEIIRQVILNKAARNMQIIITTTAAKDVYELLNIRSIAKPQGRGLNPLAERV